MDLGSGGDEAGVIIISDKKIGSTAENFLNVGWLGQYVIQ